MALQQRVEAGKPWAVTNELGDPTLADDGVCFDEILELVGGAEGCVQPGTMVKENQARALALAAERSKHVHIMVPGGEGGAQAPRADRRQSHRSRPSSAKRGPASDGASSGHDSASGVTPCRRGGREPADDVTDERRRNREAVRKYRERKKATLIQMEEELAHLRSENGTLKDLLRTIQGQVPDGMITLGQQIRAVLGEPEAPHHPPVSMLVPAGAARVPVHHLPSSCSQLPQYQEMHVSHPSMVHAAGAFAPPPVPQQIHHHQPQQQLFQPPQEAPALVPAPPPRTRSSMAAAAAAAAAPAPAAASLCVSDLVVTPVEQPAPAPEPPAVAEPSAKAPRKTTVAKDGNLGPAATFASLFHATTCMLGKHMGDKAAPLTAAANNGHHTQKKQRVA